MYAYKSLFFLNKSNFVPGFCRFWLFYTRKAIRLSTTVKPTDKMSTIPSDRWIPDKLRSDRSETYPFSILAVPYLLYGSMTRNSANNVLRNVCFDNNLKNTKLRLSLGHWTGTCWLWDAALYIGRCPWAYAPVTFSTCSQGTLPQRILWLSHKPRGYC